MLKLIVDLVCCPVCKGCLESHAFTEGSDGHIQDGVLVCNSCAMWYPILDDILELVVPALRDSENTRAFVNKFDDALRELGLAHETVDAGPASDEISKNPYRAQEEQREHFDWFCDNEDLNYTDYAQKPFWRAADALAFSRWRDEFKSEKLLLDVGCNNGRSTFPMLGDERIVIGVDISEKSLRQANSNAKERGVSSQTSFLVADGSDLPFRSEVFDIVMTYGVLHHLPNPEVACHSFYRILKPQGAYLGSENNESFLRPIFDLMMKLLPLWVELAGDEPLISDKKIRNWHADLPVSIRFRYSVYLPPHFYNLLGNSAAKLLMRLTDSLVGAIPGLRKAAGLIVYEVRKTS